MSYRVVSNPYFISEWGLEIIVLLLLILILLLYGALK